jgi:hypothetical protein
MPIFRSQVLCGSGVSVGGALNANGGVNTKGHMQFGTDDPADTLTNQCTAQTDPNPGDTLTRQSRVLELGDVTYTIDPDHVKDVISLAPTTAGRKFIFVRNSFWSGHTIWVLNEGSENLSIDDDTPNHYGTIVPDECVVYVAIGSTWKKIFRGSITFSV